ncbi:hypothetical protein Glove_218g25 [Diversispora epigaea]|uniref:Autophagy-related protein 27 n=1 Tax=Diversispora epigaea TaxID=1348612 RepID=A0A397IPD1_9GLOM|nr:hypothetical protein Glove_218g25 [Diversispora epigaea]
MRKSKSYLAVFIILINAFSQSLGVTATPLNCSDIEVSGMRFNIAALDQVLNINKTTDSPPTKKNITYFINPCSPLPYDDKADEETKLSKCHDGTLICEITTHWNPRTGITLITSVIPVAVNSTNDDNKDNDDNNQDFIVELGPKANVDDIHGPLIITLYGDKINGANDEKQQQKANITFICDPDQKNENPNVISYKDNTLQIEWKTEHACGVRIPEVYKGLGGFTKFLIFIFMVLALYLIIGAGYNYQVYRSQGWDLLPNRDFWRDVPYMASDLTKNLYNTVRGGGNSGYARV